MKKSRKTFTAVSPCPEEAQLPHTNSFLVLVVSLGSHPFIRIPIVLHVESRNLIRRYPKDERFSRLGDGDSLNSR